jgi:hypothetical protein
MAVELHQSSRCPYLHKLARSSPVLQRRIILTVCISVALVGFGIYSFEMTRDDFPLPSAPPSSPFHTRLSPTQRGHILDGEFKLVVSTQTMPDPVKHAFIAATKEKGFALANPGADYQAGDVVYDKQLPRRRLIFAGSSPGKWFIHYEQGGFAHSYYLLIFGSQSDGSWRFLWGAASTRPAKDLDELRKMIARGWFMDEGDYYW